MDDLQAKLSQLLSDPQALEQFKSLGGMLGLNTNDSPSPPPPNSHPHQENSNDNMLGNFMTDDTMKTITKLMPMLSSLKKEDESTILLEALRPFLGEARQEKLDKAKKMLQLIKILPLIKNTGIL